jgi:hypothetical protein
MVTLVVRERAINKPGGLNMWLRTSYVYTGELVTYIRGWVGL